MRAGWAMLREARLLRRAGGAGSSNLHGRLAVRPRPTPGAVWRQLASTTLLWRAKCRHFKTAVGSAVRLTSARVRSRAGPGCTCFSAWRHGTVLGWRGEPRRPRFRPSPLPAARLPLVCHWRTWAQHSKCGDSKNMQRQMRMRCQPRATTAPAPSFQNKKTKLLVLPPKCDICVGAASAFRVTRNL